MYQQWRIRKKKIKLGVGARPAAVTGSALGFERVIDPKYVIVYVNMYYYLESGSLKKNRQKIETDHEK
jgi:hypothetical protein